MSSAQISGNPNAAERCDTLTRSSLDLSNAPVSRFRRAPPVKKPRGCAPMDFMLAMQPVAHLRVAGAFPLGEPRAGERAPVSAEAEKA